MSIPGTSQAGNHPYPPTRKADLSTAKASLVAWRPLVGLLFMLRVRSYRVNFRRLISNGLCAITSSGWSLRQGAAVFPKPSSSRMPAVSLRRLTSTSGMPWPVSAEQRLAGASTIPALLMPETWWLQSENARMLAGAARSGCRLQRHPNAGRMTWKPHFPPETVALSLLTMRRIFSRTPPQIVG